MTKEKQRTYEFLGNIMVSLMDTDILITYPFLKTELHISSRDLSAMKKGSNMCIYQYVRVVSCITEQIHLGILMDVLLKQLKIMLATHSDLVIGMIPHCKHGSGQPEEWVIVMQWDGIWV
ncbi:hypothetical protein AALK94_00165 [Bacteroides faecichinchillae]|uniref:Uncharacterized protein n=1 Tax=Bacteroides faecichinchillae TaxID=871325 RepID=A0A1M5DX08_9BACE|nr:hypothetical protein [Bacteroides faecichinchillae]THG64559.1 hypothetical protein E5981_12700 [Bacteroides faecichinchillae]SHF71394.1 hypothetical protein SAMN05444349_13119 [Bacteroides faecichinchillae]